jgi:hypothetical protein
MTICRVKKDSQNPYVILNKGFLENVEISLKLKGFLAYCLSKPDNWKFFVRQLVSVLKEGKDALYGIIQEGIDHGYITKEKQRLKGKFESVEYIIREIPIQKKIAVSGNPDTDKPDTENPPLLSKDSSSLTEKKKIKKKEERERAQARREERATKVAHSPLFSHFDLVHIKHGEMESLLSELGEEKLRQMIRELNEYSKVDPEAFKRYGCHATVIRRWVRREEDHKKFEESIKTTHSKWWRNVLLKIGTRREIETTQEGVSFNYGTIYLLFKFTDSEFKLKTREQLRKMQLLNEEGE